MTDREGYSDEYYARAAEIAAQVDAGAPVPVFDMGPEVGDTPSERVAPEHAENQRRACLRVGDQIRAELLDAWAHESGCIVL